MNIIDAKGLYSNSNNLEKIEEVCKFYEKVGNNPQGAYLGSTVSDISFDKGHIEFETIHVASNLETNSTGVLLDNGVLIKQTQKNAKDEYFQIFSWNKDYSKYTYILFDSAIAMEVSFNKIADANINLCDGTLIDKLASLRIPTDAILQVKEDVEDNSNKKNVEDNTNKKVIEELTLEEDNSLSELAHKVI